MNDAPLLDLDVGELAERQVLAVRRRDQEVLDGVHVLPVAAPAAGRRGRTPARPGCTWVAAVAADRGLDQRVDVGDVQAVARESCAVRLDGQARLPQLAHERDVR